MINVFKKVAESHVLRIYLNDDDDIVLVGDNADTKVCYE